MHFFETKMMINHGKFLVEIVVCFHKDLPLIHQGELRKLCNGTITPQFVIVRDEKRDFRLVIHDVCVHVHAIGGRDIGRIADNDIEPHVSKWQMFLVRHIVTSESHPYPIEFRIPPRNLQSLL